jgi:hypothetical protein
MVARSPLGERRPPVNRLTGSAAPLIGQPLATSAASLVSLVSGGYRGRERKGSEVGTRVIRNRPTPGFVQPRHARVRPMRCDGSQRVGLDEAQVGGEKGGPGLCPNL